ncbi:DUF1217 domain-containing protein [Paracoccus sp. Z330]|uniref:DUF1217 domain-containing protein n=1 Tax=Paracoccus onchidii TaxID=3017813 RepID=A0ABT4ZIN2_9RHOB|nr:DUF1217 domain-containing protein [Paracoccus onchidii]MDB6179219.1 DUF1217 domain-containing protein [Paracoccus onchidii]
MSAISVGASGIQGWRILQNQASRHIEMVSQDPVVQRSTNTFRERIGDIETAAELVKDYKTLHVALRAFGLDDDIGSKAFIQKVLESDLDDDDSFVNRLSDARYLRLASAFDFEGGSVDVSNIQDSVSKEYIQREYEYRVGEGDENLRLALNAMRELQAMVGRESSDRTLWYEVLGNPPLKEVFSGAFGFGKHYGNLPIDRQLDEFVDASERFLGSSSFLELTSAEGIDGLMKSFLARSELQASKGQDSYSIALELLQ